MRFANIDELKNALFGEKKTRTLDQEKLIKRLKRLAGISAALIVLAAVTAFVFDFYTDKKEEQGLKTASVSVWYSVKEGSGEQAAMESIKEDFESKFPDVTLELRAISEDDYLSELSDAAKNNELPDLFESSGLPDSLLENARDIVPVLDTPQAKECLFIDKYDTYYKDHKKLPLAIEAPIAAVITSGNTAASYDGEVFEKLEDLNARPIAIDGDCIELIEKNLNSNWIGEDKFMDSENNTAAVMMTSTMHMNEIRKELVNYSKSYVFLDGPAVHCDFIYEWSIGASGPDELRASERLLSWMLGNVYQSKLMTTIASDGQIPVNGNCFKEKCESKNYKGMEKAYEHYVFN